MRASGVMRLADVRPWRFRPIPAVLFAAGAVRFVISHEIILEFHRKGHEAFATAG
ncbi:hypothetical protein H6CHR_03480 [Variovorax sp. PBL-H6]|nr:hypothetical protein H6CHR_03480 [Variovorax sp. PBL-H6]